MSDLKLNDFKKSVDKGFGPFTIEFGSEDKPRTLELVSFIVAKPAQQAAFMTRFQKVSRAMNGEISERLIADFTGLKLDADGNFPDDFDEEKVHGQIMQGATDQLKESLRALATNKKDFDAFAKEFDGEFIHWFAITAEYLGKYGVLDKNGDTQEDTLGK